MLFVGNREIDVKEYTNLSVVGFNARLVDINNHNNLNINGFRLSIAMARTLCSQHLDNREYWIDIISSLLGVSNLIANNSPNIRIKESRISQLRDFSRTNKIGEISQGVVWLYLQENGYPFINDFHFFCRQNGVTVPVAYSTPDFVCQDTQMRNNYCLCESKGKELISTTSIKDKLKYALEQCDSGESLLNTHRINVSKKIGFCTEWADDNNQRDSKLHFVDPENDFLDKKEDLQTMRIHYASWFYMIGDFENVERLLKGEKIKMPLKDFRIETIEKNNYYILDRIPYSIYKKLEKYIDRRMIFPFDFYGFSRLDSSVGISQDVISFLSENESVDLKTFENVSNEIFDLFTDGTIILKLRNE